MSDRSFSVEAVAVTAVHQNTSQEIIAITEDKLRLRLDEFVKCADKSRDWQFPLGLVVALGIAWLTSDFKDAMGLDKATWRGFFILLTLASVAFLVWTLRNVRSRLSVDDLVRRIKNVSLNSPEKN